MKTRQWIRNQKDNGFSFDEIRGMYKQYESEVAEPSNIESFYRAIRAVRPEYNQDSIPKDYDNRDYDDEPMTPSDVSTLELAEIYHEIDLSKWYPVSLTVNTWGSKGNENKQVKAKYNYQMPTLEALRDELMEMFDGFTPNLDPIERPLDKSGRTAEIAIFDHHIGKDIWGKLVSGEDYSSEEAERLFLQAVDHLTSGFEPNSFDRILFPIGNDLINFDNLQKTTTRGTPQGGGKHYFQVLEIALRTLLSAIARLRKFGPVDVIVVPGNHDFSTMYQIGMTLEAYYRTIDDVTVDNSVDFYKFRASGNWLIGYTHGKHPDSKKTLKPDEHILNMAIESRDLWANAKYCEMHVGHLHGDTQTYYRTNSEEKTVRFKVLPSLCPTDMWHKASGYHSVREAVLNILSDDKGIIESRFFRV